MALLVAVGKAKTTYKKRLVKKRDICKIQDIFVKRL
jgi:hypothetical protein